MADDPKASVLGELAHELLQPLTGIRSSAELLLEARPGDAAVAARVATIVQQVDRVQAILARARRQGAPAPEARADLNQAVDVAWSLLERDAERQGTVLVRELAPSLPKVTAEQIAVSRPSPDGAGVSASGPHLPGRPPKPSSRTMGRASPRSCGHACSRGWRRHAAGGPDSGSTSAVPWPRRREGRSSCSTPRVGQSFAFAYLLRPRLERCE